MNKKLKNMRKHRLFHPILRLGFLRNFIFKYRFLLYLVGIVVLSIAIATPSTSASTVTFTDDFNRADGAVGNGWVIEGTAKKTFTILNQSVRGDNNANPGSTFNYSRLVRPETSLDQTVTIDVVMGAELPSRSMGIVLREHGTSSTSSTAYYGAGGGGIGISKVIAGTATSLWAPGLSYNTTDTYRQMLSAIGANPTTLCLTIENLTTSTKVVDNHCLTDSTTELQSAGKVALNIPRSTNFFDNFVYTYESSATAPDAPTSLSATPASTQVALTWSAPSDDGGSSITDYVVQYKETSSGTWNTFNDGTSTNTNATVTGLINGTQYDFRVAAVNIIDTGTYSSVITATPIPGATAPDAPTSLSTTPASTQVALTWSAPGDDGGSPITDYIVQYKASADSTWLTFNDGTSTNTNATVIGLTNGTQYDFRVSAVNIINTGTYSSVVSATPVGAPTVTFTDDFNRANGSVGNGWTIEGTAKKTFTILNQTVRGDDNAALSGTLNYSRLVRPETSLNQTVTSDFTAGAELPIRWMGIALREHGTASSTSTSYFATGGAAIRINKTVAGTGTLLWDFGSGYNTTDTYRHTFSAIGANPTTLCLTVDNLTTGTNIVNNHCLTDSTPQLQTAGKVSINITRSTNFMDNFTYEYESSATAPDAPTSLSATPASTQVALTWSAPSDDGGSSITDYVVQYKATADSTWNTFNDGISTNTNATITGLTNGTQYNFRVAAVNIIDTGAYSSVITATPAVAPSTYTVLQSDLWDNGYLQPTDHPYNSSFSRFVFDTTSDYIIVNMVIAPDNQAPMGVKIDGVVQSSITTASNTINLGNLGQSKHVEITTGYNSNPNIVDPAGNYLTSIQYNASESLTVVPPQSVSDRIVVLGDSISVGRQNVDPPNTAMVNKLRASGYSVMSEGSSGDWLGRWNQGTYSSPNFTKLVNRLVSYAPETIWIQIGHNDVGRLGSVWGNNIYYFGNAYTLLIDQLHAALPNTHIFCQSVMATSPVTANDFGNKQLQVCGDSARKVYAAPVNARDFIPGYGAVGTYMFDPAHPNAAGDEVYANRIKEYLATLNPNISVTAGSDNFMEGHASSNLEYTIADSSANDDAKLVNRLVKVNINGSTVDSSNYSITGTPAVLFFSQAYLNTLSVGTKNLDVYFTGNIKTSDSFTVAPFSATAPSAPTSLSATPGSTQVALAWSAPSDDGGLSITDYIVQYKETSSGTWSTFNDGTSTNTNATVTSLTNGTQYDFRVAAVNSVGIGTYSSVVTATPTVTPTATPTSTPTTTPTPTTTTTPAPTTTPTDIPTATPTNTPTATPTNTPTATPTNTPTAIPTSTPTSTPTATPINIPTATPTTTLTNTLTNTPTAIPTTTPTDIPTPTPTNTILFSNPESRQPIILTIPVDTELTCHSAVMESSLNKKDSRFSYPLGLIDFCFDTNYSNNQINLLFVTDLKPSEVEARKYNTVTEEFSSIPDATVTETTHNGQHALRLIYTVIDNGPLDQDPVIGQIKDPASLGLKLSNDNPSNSTDNNIRPDGSNDTDISNTDLPQQNTYIYGLVGIIGLALFAIVYRRYKQA